MADELVWDMLIIKILFRLSKCFVAPKCRVDQISHVNSTKLYSLTHKEVICHPPFNTHFYNALEIKEFPLILMDFLTNDFVVINYAYLKYLGTRFS